MRVGTITIDGSPVGIIDLIYGDVAIDPYIPDLEGYEPQGRADAAPFGTAPAQSSGHVSPLHSGASIKDRAMHGREHVGASMEDRARHGAHRLPGKVKQTQLGPEGPAHTKTTTEPGSPVNRGSESVNRAIEEAAKAHNLKPEFMKSVASIESGMNPASNAHNIHKYKGLYQIGPGEWNRFGGGGNIYNAHDNAMAAARMFEANADAFKAKFGRSPTDTEMYLMHQQGLGFYTRGAMTNIAGNLPAGARTPDNMTHEGFEKYWGDQVKRREAQFENPEVSSRAPPHANYMRGPLPSGSDMENITTAGGHSFNVNPKSAPAIKGFVEDLEKAGAPIHDIGGYNRREIAGSGRWSQHAYGNAIDINQSSRNVTSRDFEDWRKTHDSELRAALVKHNMISGGDWSNPDFGHFEWGGPKSDVANK